MKVRSAPKESVTPPSNQHSDPAEIPHSTTPSSQAARKATSTPCNRQTASMLAVLPPPTYTRSLPTTSSGIAGYGGWNSGA